MTASPKVEEETLAETFAQAWAEATDNRFMNGFVFGCLLVFLGIPIIQGIELLSHTVVGYRVFDIVRYTIRYGSFVGFLILILKKKEIFASGFLIGATALSITIFWP